MLRAAKRSQSPVPAAVLPIVQSPYVHLMTTVGCVGWGGRESHFNAHVAFPERYKTTVLR